MSWFSFSSQYTPADFKGKAIKDIMTMDPKKVDKDFLTKYAAEINEGEKALSEKQKNAIQLLIDLSDKAKIFENCYEKKSTPKQAQPAQAQPAPTEEDDEEDEEERERERAQEVKLPERDERALVQGGGRRKRGRKSKRTSKRSSKRTSKRTKRGGRKSKRTKKSKRKTRKH